MGFLDFLKKADENFEHGVKYLETDNYPEAINFFKQVKESAPNYERALTYIVSSLTALGEDKEAIKWFAKIPSSTPYYDQAIADVVGAYANTNQCREALKWADKVPVSSNYYSVALINRLVALLNVEDIKAYLDECDKALICFTKLSQSDQFYSLSLEYLLKVLSEYTKFGELLDYSNQFLELEENNPLGLYFKGEALYELEKYDSAFECLNKIQCHSDEFIDAMYVKALIHEQFGNEEEARKCWDEVDRIESSNTSTIITDRKGNKEVVTCKGRAPRKRLV